MKKHTKFIAYTLAGFMAVSAINVPSVYAEEIPTETVVDTTNNSATDTTTETPTDSTADSSTETPADSAKDESKTDTVKKATATKKQTVKIKKYKKSKKLYVKKATKAYKVTSTGKLKVAKSLKKSAKVTVVGTSTVKKVKYYAIKSGKSTLLVKQSLLSKTKPHSSKPSSKPSTNRGNNSSNKPSKTKYNYTYNDKGQKVVTQDNGVPSNAANYAWDDFIRCKMPGVKPHHGDKCIGYKMVSGKKKNIYYNKKDNKCYYIDWDGLKCDVMHKDVWDGLMDGTDDGFVFE